MKRFAWILFAMVMCIGCGDTPVEEPESEPDIFSDDHISTVMLGAFDWQNRNLVSEAPLPDGGFQEVRDTEWVRGAYWAGVMAASAATGNPKYLRAAYKMSEGNTWQPGPRPRCADDHCIAQTYVRIYLLDPDERYIDAIVARFDEMIADPRPGPVVGWSDYESCENWWWCDALFMAPPTMALVAEATGDVRYLDHMNTRWWETYDYLYDPEEHLWFRDGRYVIQEDGSGPRTSNGQKIFWSRGNGWVFAGLAQVLDVMPADYPDRPRYEELFREMAVSLVAIQGEDGLWRSSLHDPEEFPTPESSGTGFFTYGLAWGVNNGLLDAATFVPAARNGWQGLNWALHPDGRLGWVQQIGYDPREDAADDSMAYGTGAFLLAGSEMLRLEAQSSSEKFDE